MTPPTAPPADPERRARLAAVWRSFAASECRGYSPLYDRISCAVAEDDAVLDLALAAPPFGRQPNVLLAAVHDLVLRGTDHDLAGVYAAAADRSDAGTLFCDFVRAHAEAVEAILAFRRTNTNECGRSAVLVPALRWCADRIGEPVALVDGGCSAGLNLGLDEYLIDYGEGRTTGPRDAAVRITCALEGDAPIHDRAPAIAGRIGLDRAPVDLTDEAERRWLLACVWPDTGRLDRTRAALDLALRRRAERPIVEGDLVDDLAPTVARLPKGVRVCVMTSWVVAYLPTARRPELNDALARLSVDRAVHWISAEASGVVVDPPADRADESGDGPRRSVLAVLHFAGGRHTGTTVLGRCHPHGSSLVWDELAI